MEVTLNNNNMKIKKKVKLEKMRVMKKKNKYHLNKIMLK